jgi:hypothetical protein
VFEQDVEDRARALEGITFGPYELFFDVFEGLETFSAIDATQICRDMELLHAAKQQVDALNLRPEALDQSLSESDSNALHAHRYRRIRRQFRCAPHRQPPFAPKSAQPKRYTRRFLDWDGGRYAFC